MLTGRNISCQPDGAFSRDILEQATNIDAIIYVKSL